MTKQSISKDERTSALGLMRFANEYFNSAIATKKSLQYNTTTTPVYFLLGHSIELSIKSYLRSRGCSVKEISSLKHDLSACLETAKSKGISGYFILSDEFNETFHLINSLHKTTELRYIVTGSKCYPKFENLRDLAWTFLEKLAPEVGWRLKT
ncbi:MAG: hypothetical protein AAF204_00445 [Pseudomonadota bacterium]